MSQVRRGTANVDTTPVEFVDYPAGGVFVAALECSNLGIQTITLSAYTRAHEAAVEVLAKSVSLVGSGPTPADPSILELEVVSAQPVRFDANVSVGPPADFPWWIESVGQVATIEDGEGTLTADGSEQTLVTSAYRGTFMLLVDVTAMQAGDDVKLRLKSLREGSYYVQKYVLLEDAQTNKIYGHGPLIVPEKCRATLQQTAGTNRSFPWAVVRLG